MPFCPAREEWGTRRVTRQREGAAPREPGHVRQAGAGGWAVTHAGGRLPLIDFSGEESSRRQPTETVDAARECRFGRSQPTITLCSPRRGSIALRLWPPWPSGRGR